MEYVKIVFSAIGTFFVYLLGGYDVALECLLIAIILDYITGLMKSYKNSTLNSEKGLKGIIKKVGLLMLVAVAVLVDNLVIDSGIINTEGLIRSGVIYYIVANECLSILENLGEMNIVVPKFLKLRLEQIKDSVEENNESGEE